MVQHLRNQIQEFCSFTFLQVDGTDAKIETPTNPVNSTMQVGFAPTNRKTKYLHETANKRSCKRDHILSLEQHKIVDKKEKCMGNKYRQMQESYPKRSKSPPPMGRKDCTERSDFIEIQLVAMAEYQKASVRFFDDNSFYAQLLRPIQVQITYGSWSAEGKYAEHPLQMAYTDVSFTMQFPLVSTDCGVNHQAWRT